MVICLCDPMCPCDRMLVVWDMAMLQAACCSSWLVSLSHYTTHPVGASPTYQGLVSAALCLWCQIVVQKFKLTKSRHLSRLYKFCLMFYNGLSLIVSLTILLMNIIVEECEFCGMIFHLTFSLPLAESQICSPPIPAPLMRSLRCWDVQSRYISNLLSKFWVFFPSH